MLNVFGSSNPILFVVFVETIGVFWFYGVSRFCDDVEQMIGSRPSRFWRVTWKFISPAFLLVVYLRPELPVLNLCHIDHPHLQPHRLHIPGRFGAIQEVTAGTALPGLAGLPGLVHDSLIHLAHTCLRCLSLLHHGGLLSLGETRQDLLPPGPSAAAQVSVEQQDAGHHVQDLHCQRHSALV